MENMFMYFRFYNPTQEKTFRNIEYEVGTFAKKKKSNLAYDELKEKMIHFYFYNLKTQICFKL